MPRFRRPQTDLPGDRPRVKATLFLQSAYTPHILVCMTRSVQAPPRSAPVPTSSWRLNEAKARFSELVRRAQSEGPQHVTVHGREEVVVIGADEFRRLKGERSGETIVAAMQASPLRDIELQPGRARMPVRDIEL